MNIDVYPWQEGVWRRWHELSTRLPHAVLLKGMQGTGKFDFAMNMAQSVLCEKPESTGFACGNCPSCHWMQQQSHPDFRLLQPEALTENASTDTAEGKKKPSRQISVDQVRDLMDFVNLSAHRGGRRVVLIHPAESMNLNAANALLKTLEEPTPGMLIILVTHKAQQLLPTIRSRCLTISIPLPSAETSIAWLMQQGINDPQERLRLAGFAPLQVIRSTEDMNNGLDFLKGISNSENFNAYVLAEQFQREEPAQFIHWLQQWCYDLTSMKLSGKVRYHPGQQRDIAIVSEKMDTQNLLQYQKELQIAKREALHPLNPRLLLESLLLAYRQLLPVS